MLIQKLRLKKGWSQQQLAEASGLSVRTIQRLEAGYAASTESLKALAAVFEIDFTQLQGAAMSPTTTPETSPNTTEQEEAEALRFVRDLRGFYQHLLRYVLIIAALWGINLWFSPHVLWAQWPMLGWGLGLALHGFGVFKPDWPLGPRWEKRQVEKRLGRPL